ncbi:hypothetical protein BDD12DRAFT_883602 [Trichophaea hybrida]|nr:hypothetical protein BDD12DRAFT_883602 [Trichophaea hybrida]
MLRIGTGISLPVANLGSQIQQDEYKLMCHVGTLTDQTRIEEFAETIIAMAEDLAWQNSIYYKNEILGQSLNISIAAAEQLHFNKLSVWQVAMSEEHELVATDLRQHISGKGYK